MKIALIGNCQLQQIGWFLKAFFEIHKLEHTVVWYEPIFALGDKNAQIIPLFKILDDADMVYGQFHDEKWNSFSTASLCKYFPIRLVPTLESTASFPQMNYFSDAKMNYNFYSIDFRMLHCYLSGVPMESAPQAYFDVALNAEALAQEIETTSNKYASKYAEKKVIFDYSQEYRNAMAHEAVPYFVHNHPNNRQLQWLANQILLDMKSPMLVSLENMLPILNDTIVPALNGVFQDAYRIRSQDLRMQTACKVNYFFFSSYEKDFLQKELEISPYWRLVQH